MFCIVYIKRVATKPLCYVFCVLHFGLISSVVNVTTGTFGDGVCISVTVLLCTGFYTYLILDILMVGLCVYFLMGLCLTKKNGDVIFCL